MTVMCLIKITNITSPHPPSVKIAWLENFLKHSDPYFYFKYDHNGNSINYDISSYNDRANFSGVLLFDSEEELNAWANNCRLTDPVLIADQETWNRAHGITFAYEYYSLSTITGPDPII